MQRHRPCAPGEIAKELAKPVDGKEAESLVRQFLFSPKDANVAPRQPAAESKSESKDSALEGLSLFMLLLFCDFIVDPCTQMTTRTWRASPRWST